MFTEVLVFMSPSDSVAQLYPQSLGTIFVAFYHKQSCGGDIVTDLHSGTLLYIVLPNEPPKIFHPHWP
jgi:hypothetical protein